MLNAMRKGAGTWVVRIFLMVLVASFAVWGIGDIFRSRSTTGVITVGEREVGADEVASAFNRDVRRLQAQLRQPIDAQQARDMGLLQNTVRQIVARGLFDEATRELDMTVPDDALAREIRENPAFRDDFDRFDRFRFENLLRENGYTEATFIDVTRRDMARAQLLDSLTAGAQAPEPMVEAYYRFQQERRVADILRLPDDNLVEVPAPTEDELKAYHQSHAARYTAPEYRAITYLTLRPSDLVDEVAVSEDEVREAYQDRISQFRDAPKRTVEQILFDDEATAALAAEKISAGMDFATAANEVGKTDVTELGEVTPTALPLERETVDAIFALPSGGVSAPVQSDFGWHLFRVSEIVSEGSTTSFEEVRDQVERDLRLERAVDLLYDTANKIEDSFAGGASVEEVAQTFRLTVVRVPAVDRRGQDRGGDAVAELPADPAFLEEAFVAQVGDEPRLIEASDDSYFLVRVDEIVDPAIRPLDEAREAVVTDWTNEKRTELAEAKVAELAETARGGTSLEELSADIQGASVSTTEPLLRTEYLGQAGVAEEVVRELFAASPDEVVVGASGAGNERIVARLVEVKDADLGTSPEALEQIRELVRQAMVEDIRNQFQFALSNSYDVTVNEAAIQSIFDQTVQ